jgi:hypothetical protein
VQLIIGKYLHQALMFLGGMARQGWTPPKEGRVGRCDLSIERFDANLLR